MPKIKESSEDPIKRLEDRIKRLEQRKKVIQLKQEYHRAIEAMKKKGERA